MTTGSRLACAAILSIGLHLAMFAIVWAEMGQSAGEIGSGTAGGGIRSRLAARLSPARIKSPVPFNDWMDRPGTSVPNMRMPDTSSQWTHWAMANGGRREDVQTAGPSRQDLQLAHFVSSDKLDRKPVPASDPDFSSLGINLDALKPFRLRLYIGNDGTVKKIELLQAAPDDLASIVRVEEALSNIRFNPGVLEGKTVACFQDMEFASVMGERAPVQDIEPLPVTGAKSVAP